MGASAKWAVGFEIFIGLGALFGGGQFIIAPDGHLLGMTTQTLAASPFRNYLVPGIILFTFVGVAPLVAAAMTLRRHPLAPLAATAVGVILIGWISVEMVFLAGPGSLAWSLYLVVGTALATIGFMWWRSAR